MNPSQETQEISLRNNDGFTDENISENRRKKKVVPGKQFFHDQGFKVARLDFLGGYLPSLSVNYVGMSKDMEKRLPQLYYIKMKISYDLGFIAIGVAMAT